MIFLSDKDSLLENSYENIYDGYVSGLQFY